jgi:predicted nucleic acid-binding protein
LGGILSHPTNTQLLPGKRFFDKVVLIDTSALVALAVSTDKYHIDAVNCLELISQNHLPVYVTVPTIYETQRVLLFKLGPQKSTQFVREIYDGSLNIERTKDDDDQKAFELLMKFNSTDLTLTDASNMALMIRLGIAKAFSFDHHFLELGFIRIPPF